MLSQGAEVTKCCPVPVCPFLLSDRMQLYWGQRCTQVKRSPPNALVTRCCLALANEMEAETSWETHG